MGGGLDCAVYSGKTDWCYIHRVISRPNAYTSTVIAVQHTGSADSGGSVRSKLEVSTRVLIPFVILFSTPISHLAQAHIIVKLKMCFHRSENISGPAGRGRCTCGSRPAGPEPPCSAVPSHSDMLHWHDELVFHVVVSPLYFKVSSSDPYILYPSIMDSEKS